MPYRLKRSESVPDSVKRIAREQMTSAIECLRGASGVSREEAVHQARKSIKKMRALMRLVRPELGAGYKAESAVLREAGRQLSPIRDAAALIGAFDDLTNRSGKGIGEPTARQVREALVVHKRRVEKDAGIDELLPVLAGRLAGVRKSVKNWPLQKDGPAAIESGLEEAFRRGRKAMAVAKNREGRDDFHQWRKRVKDHWYHVRLMEKLWKDVLKGYQRSLSALDGALGEDLNLALLRQLIDEAPQEFGGGGGIEPVVQTIGDVRKELRAQALEIGERVYAEKPRAVAKAAGRLWKVWRG